MKRFHITGNCVPEQNYLVDTSKKIDQIMTMIEQGDYFVINRPRQYGKTTTIFQLRQRLLNTEDYLPIKLSFEGAGEATFASETVFSKDFLTDLADDLLVIKHGYDNIIQEHNKKVESLKELSKVLTKILSKIPKKIVLLIDEVDKSSNNDLFLNFLAMLRDKFLNARAGLDITFHSIILAGVHDIKSLKQKIRPDSQSQINSPWNIAVPFEVDMSFSPAEIETMLTEYVAETGIQMDTKAISERIYYWTSGYPFLVSYMCKMIAEKILPAQQGKVWEVKHIDQVAKIAAKDNNTLFDVLFKNLQSYHELNELIEGIVLGNREFPFDMQNIVCSLAFMHGFITCNEHGNARIHNRIFYERIINFYISKISTDNILHTISHQEWEYIKKNGKLDFELVLKNFQDLIKKKYSKDEAYNSDEFLHKNLRLLFLVYLDPIVNGHGHTFKEVEIGAEKRLDIVVTYLEEMFVVELKVWHGPKLHEQGKQQLKQYMQNLSINKGYMLIVNKNTSKTFKREMEDGILMVYV